MSLLSLKSVSAGYNGRPVIDNLSFSVEAGEIVGVIGPNGSGKSTLIKAMTCFLPLMKGEISFKERSVSQMPLSELARQLAVVNQHSSTELQLSVAAYVLLGRMPYRDRWHMWESTEDVKIADHAMQQAGVMQLKNRIFSELSGGERQSVVIARALAQQPEILVLDEPTTHLDIAHQVNLLDLLRRLNKEQGLTIITVLHDLNLAAEYCDRLILLNKGNLFVEGRPEEVLSYETIEAVYETLVVVGKNPVTGKPVIFMVPEESRLATGVMQE
ncbi:ABC transporter ATP-binding protein [bacterium]|nr:ABC transporter ATP-binding protein [bacterium]